MFWRFDRHRAHAAHAAFPRHFGILLVVSRVGVSELFQREWVLAGYAADERLAVFLVLPQAEVMAELEDSLLGWAALLRSGDLRLESVLHGYSFGEVLIS